MTTRHRNGSWCCAGNLTGSTRWSWANPKRLRRQWRMGNFPQLWRSRERYSSRSLEVAQVFRRRYIQTGIAQRWPNKFSARIAWYVPSSCYCVDLTFISVYGTAVPMHSRDPTKVGWNAEFAGCNCWQANSHLYSFSIKALALCWWRKLNG